MRLLLETCIFMSIIACSFEEAIHWNHPTVSGYRANLSTKVPSTRWATNSHWWAIILAMFHICTIADHISKVKPDATPDEIEQVLDSDEAPQIFAQSVRGWFIWLKAMGWLLHDISLCKPIVPVTQKQYWARYRRDMTTLKRLRRLFL